MRNVCKMVFTVTHYVTVISITKRRKTAKVTTVTRPFVGDQTILLRAGDSYGE